MGWPHQVVGNMLSWPANGSGQKGAAKTDHYTNLTNLGHKLCTNIIFVCNIYFINVDKETGFKQIYKKERTNSLTSLHTNKKTKVEEITIQGETILPSTHSVSVGKHKFNIYTQIIILDRH